METCLACQQKIHFKLLFQRLKLVIPTGAYWWLIFFEEREDTEPRITDVADLTQLGCTGEELSDCSFLD